VEIQASGNVVWEWRAWEHLDPVKDGITAVQDDRDVWTCVLEIDPATKNIVWKFQEAIPSNFFSPRISNAQRLSNGNTLIDEGWFGRFFEVTLEGDVVWEYVNPYFGGPPKAQSNSVFRVYRYSAAEIARAQAAT
jgi:hypothetical protein